MDPETEARELFLRESITAIGDRLQARLDETLHRLVGDAAWAEFDRPVNKFAAVSKALVLEAGDIRLDRRAGMAWIGERPIVLGPTEFELLALFLSNAGSVIHRAALMQRLFGDHPSAGAALDAEVEQLRRKLGDDPVDPARVVQVGDGYRYRVQERS